jgi:hemolysin activation/secretion protein
MCSRHLLVFTGIVSITTTVNTYAQAVLPGSVEPGRIEQRFQEPLKPKSQPEIKVPEKVEQIPPEQAEKIRFNLTSIQLDGNTVFDTTSLYPLWESLLGKEVTLAQVYKIADAITSQYRNAGYILTQAIVPPQKITNGIVVIKIIEGYANDVLIEGNEQGRHDLFQGWIEKIKASRPLKNDVLERYTLIANDLPGVSVKSVIRPSKTTPGASDVVLMVEHHMLDASVSSDNRGSKTIGPEQVTLNVDLNSLLNLYEKTGLTYLTTGDGEELKYFGFQQDHALTSEGLHFNFNGNISYSQPGDNLKRLNIKGENTTLNSLFSYPVIRSRTENLSIQGGLTIRDSKTTTFNQLLSEDRLRVLKLGVNYDIADAWQGVNMANLMLSKGVDIFDATETGSPNLTRADGHSQFTKLGLDISRTQPLISDFALYMAGSGQLSDVSLLSSEEFGFGGAQYGRAYDPSSITGDNGIAGKAELQYTGKVDTRISNYYQVYSFYDIGAVYSNSHLKTRHDSGSALGGGVRFGVTEYFSSTLEIAQPLTQHISALNKRDDYPRFLFNVNAKY